MSCIRKRAFLLIGFIVLARTRAWAPLDNLLPKTAHATKKEDGLDKATVSSTPRYDTTSPEKNAVASFMTAATAFAFHPACVQAAADNYYQNLYTTSDPPTYAPQVISVQRSVGSPLELVFFAGIVFVLLQISKQMEIQYNAVGNPIAIPTNKGKAEDKTSPPSSFFSKNPTMAVNLAPPPSPVKEVSTSMKYSDYTGTLPQPVAAPTETQMQTQTQTPVQTSSFYPSFEQGSDVPPVTQVAASVSVDTPPDKNEAPKSEKPKEVPPQEYDFMADFIAACKAGGE